MSAPTPTPAPLVVEIARRLASHGEFVMHVEATGWRSGQLQAVVDVGWAARQAGVMLERPVRVDVRRSDALNTYTVTAELVG
ncbi:MAG TPA: hypothetical protein VFE07_11175 [Marmoricola sp.]|nr:hypothetical protein [Marmoricola sp.]